MNPDLLAKLTAHGVPLEGTHGGKAQLTAQDVAAALAGVSENGYRLLLAKYCDEPSKPLEEAVIAHAKAHAGLLLSKHKGRVLSLALYLLDSYVVGHRCRSCKGTGHRRDTPTEVCPACDGTTNREPTMQDGATHLDMDYRTYRANGWAGLAREIWRELYDWEMRALRDARRI